MARIKLEGILSFLGTVLSLGIWKKKPWCLWVRRAARWENMNPAGNSHRKCEQALEELRGRPEYGELEYLILPRNIHPPD
jgi:hypothetical protein